MRTTIAAPVQHPRAERHLSTYYGTLPHGLDPARFPIIAEHVFGLTPSRRNARPRAKPIAIDYERVGAGTWRHVKAITRPAGQRIMPGAAQ